ncbi:MAG: M23 family metallopeptidase [Holosporales bacterium]|nr:M23 family metallopeptidase [Holosporales bacterium]
MLLALICGHALWKARSPTNHPTPSILRDTTSAVPVPCPELVPPSAPLDWMRWVADMGDTLPAPCTIVDTSSVRPKETLSGFLLRVGIDPLTTKEIAKILGKEPFSLKVGQKISYTLEHIGSQTHLRRLVIPVDFGKEIVVAQRGNGTYLLRKVSLPIVKTVRCVRGVLRTSFLADIIRCGAPKEIAKSISGAFGNLINFKRSLHPGDRFEILFDQVSTKGSMESKPGKLLYASIASNSGKVAVYRFPGKGGDSFYTANAENVQRSAFGLPIQGARKTSGFGRRTHPVSGRIHCHRGIDFSAPRGTPILASAEGVIEKVSSEHGYGRCVTIRHPGGYGTFYAHLSHFAKGIRPGMHVKRGQVIGNVGASGNATGSHLHYEVRLRGSPINPASIQSLSGNKLSGKDLRRFQELKRELDTSVKRIAL